MSIKQIEADIAEGTYANPLDDFLNRLEKHARAELALGSLDDWDRGADAVYHSLLDIIALERQR
jgi:hypothetical protein